MVPFHLNDWILFTSLTEFRAFEMRLCHPPDGSTTPKYKLLCFITTKNFCKEKNTLAFNRDKCCHLVLCLRLTPFHWKLVWVQQTENCLLKILSFFGKVGPRPRPQQRESGKTVLYLLIIIIIILMGHHHPLAGFTNPNYKLLHFLTTKFFLHRAEGTSF